MNETKHLCFPFFNFYRNASLLSTRMDQPPKIYGYACHCLVNGHLTLWHGLRWYSIRGERANRQRCSQFPNIQFGASDCLSAMPGLDPPPTRVLPLRTAEPGTNSDSSVVLPRRGSDESRWCFTSRLSFRYGCILTICVAFILRGIHTCSIASSCVLHLGWLFALLADTIRLNGFFITQQYDRRGWPARLRVRNGSRHLSQGAMGSLRKERVSWPINQELLKWWP